MSGTVFEKKGALLTVRPEGRLDTAASLDLNEELAAQLDGVTEIIMDFEKVEYIASSGLRVLLTAEQKMEECGGKMKLIHVNEYIIAIFDLVGFMDVITVERG
ncbi:MAG: STAS domain-containing protein [Clostridia bacterium]|nr:STAS domain-containing protein [Clostridia bacterium]